MLNPVTLALDFCVNFTNNSYVACTCASHVSSACPVYLGIVCCYLETHGIIAIYAVG